MPAKRAKRASGAKTGEPAEPGSLPAKRSCSSRTYNITTIHITKTQAPKKKKKAKIDGVIKALTLLLIRRPYNFRKRWRRLRSVLFYTEEYGKFLFYVRARSGGVCEGKHGRCGHRAVHVHHKVPVSVDPTLAVDIKNGIHLCRSCHQAEHDFPIG